MRDTVTGGHLTRALQSRAQHPWSTVESNINLFSCSLLTDRWTDGQMDGWIDGWIDGQTDGWTDRPGTCSW